MIHFTQIALSGKIFKTEIPFSKTYKSSEDQFTAIETEITQQGIKVKYRYDCGYYVEFTDEADFLNFPFKVISGRWFGGEDGGRLQVYKRRFGEYHFKGIINLEQSQDFKQKLFWVKKPRFINQFVIGIASQEVGVLKFRCHNFEQNWSSEFFFLDRNNVYVDVTDHFPDHGVYYNRSNDAKYAGVAKIT